MIVCIVWRCVQLLHTYRNRAIITLFASTQQKGNSMKISKREFAEALSAAFDELKRESPTMANYNANIRHNAGRWNYWSISRVEINGVMFYCAPCCSTANSDISVIKRVCARN